MKCSGILFSFYLAKGASCPPYRWHIFRPIFCCGGKPTGKKKKSLKNLHPPRVPPSPAITMGASLGARPRDPERARRVVAFCCLLSVYLLPRKFPWLVFFMISLVIKAWQGNGIEVAPCMCLQGPLSMFTFIRNYKRHDLMSGNRLGNEMYSNMLAVHTFFLPSSSVVHSHFHLGLSPKALSDFPFFFCLFCQLLSLTLPPDTQLVRPAN